MRGLTDAEAYELYENSGPADTFKTVECPAAIRTVERLERRGLVVWIDHDDGSMIPEVTPRGRLALRIYNMLKAGSAS